MKKGYSSKELVKIPYERDIDISVCCTIFELSKKLSIPFEVLLNSVLAMPKFHDEDTNEEHEPEQGAGEQNVI